MDISGFKMFKNPVPIIGDLQFISFSDMFLEHNIFLHGRISALYSGIQH
jgi:hypothetical protein